MNSRLLECRLLHHRSWPKEHRFTNRLFFAALDLDELPALHAQLRLFSVNRRNLYALRENDYLRGAPAPGGTSADDSGLRSSCAGWLRQNGEELRPGDRVWLVTIPRVAGYQFNPVSFYFFVRDGRTFCATAEVTNTFHEVKRYFLGRGTARADGGFRLRVPKHFYVSPFSDADTEFEFMLRWDGRRLAVQIDEHQHGRRILHSVLTGESRALTDATLARFALRYPLLGLQVITRIHAQALRLYLKRLPWRRKAEQPEWQRGFHPAPPTSPATFAPSRTP